jgi:hypothetical protein
MILLLLGVQGGGGSGGNANAFTTFQYVFVTHLAHLRATNPGIDLTTLVAADIKTVRAAVTPITLNTDYAEYLLTHD